MQHTINVPEWASTVGDFADTLRTDGEQPLSSWGDQILDMIDEAKRHAEDAAELRAILVSFGALMPDDYATGPLDLLAVLLPDRAA